jgi:hypothetical protein
MLYRILWRVIHPNCYTDIYSQQNCCTGVPLATHSHSRDCVLLCISWFSSLLPFVFLCHFISISKFHNFIKIMIKYFTWCLLHAGFMLGLLVHSEVEGKMFLQNLTWASITYIVLYPNIWIFLMPRHRNALISMLLATHKHSHIKQQNNCTSVSADTRAVILVCKQGWTPWRCVISANLNISSRFLSYLSCLQQVQKINSVWGK